MLTLILLKMYRYLLFCLVLLTACKHSQDCPGFDDRDAAWLVYHVNDTIKFTNAANDKIRFVTTQRNTDPSYSEVCHRGEPAGYYCKPCTSSASVSAVTDTLRRNYYRINLEMLNPDGNLSFAVYDNMGILDYDYDTHTVKSADKLDTLTLGGTLYHDVYFHEVDTLLTFMTNTIVWKTYYNKQYGILGFYDRQTHSLFYRE